MHPPKTYPVPRKLSAYSIKLMHPLLEPASPPTDSLQNHDCSPFSKRKTRSRGHSLTALHNPRHRAWSSPAWDPSLCHRKESGLPSSAAILTPSTFSLPRFLLSAGSESSGEKLSTTQSKLSRVFPKCRPLRATQNLIMCLIWIQGLCRCNRQRISR